MSSISNRQKMAVDALRTVLIAGAPYDTGNLALNSIMIIQGEPGVYGVAIGGELAPYAKYTNEPWEKGENPNEGWIQRCINEALPAIKNIMNGTLTTDEVNEYLNDYHKISKQRQLDAAIRKEKEARALESKILKKAR